jgi:hypothetical protein
LCSPHVSPLGQLVNSLAIEHHQYADDTQLFLAMRLTSIQSDLTTLQNCMHVMKQWFAANSLPLNPDKLEVVAFVSAHQLTVMASVANVTGLTLPVSLGVILDSKLTFLAHVAAVSKACSYHIWDTCHIRHMLPPEAARTLT